MVNDAFCEMADHIPLGTSIPSESVEDEVHHVYQTLFADHFEGKES